MYESIYNVHAAMETPTWKLTWGRATLSRPTLSRLLNLEKFMQDITLFCMVVTHSHKLWSGLLDVVFFKIIINVSGINNLITPILYL